jgi:hypothetical protein
LNRFATKKPAARSGFFVDERGPAKKISKTDYVLAVAASYG